MKIFGLVVRGEFISSFLRCFGFLLSLSITASSSQNGCSSSLVPSQESVSGSLQLGFGRVRYGSGPRNNIKREFKRDDVMYVELMSSRLDLTAPTAYQGPRTLLKEGTVTKSKSGRKLTMVLCNDIIVLVESRNLYRMVCSFLLLQLLTRSFDIYSFLCSCQSFEIRGRMTGPRSRWECSGRHGIY